MARNGDWTLFRPMTIRHLRWVQEMCREPNPILAQNVQLNGKDSVTRLIVEPTYRLVLVIEQSGPAYLLVQ